MIQICTKPVLCRHFYMWSLIYHFIAHSLYYKLVKTRRQYYVSIQSYGILKTVKTSNLKSHNIEKMAVKEKELYFNIIKILEKSSKNLGHCFIEGLWFIEKYIQLRGYRPSTPEYCYKKYL